MKIKKGASIQGLQLEMRHVLIQVDRIYEELGYETIITSGTDSIHSAGSLHYYGYALDFRTRHMELNETAVLFAKVLASLDDEYKAVLHKTHLHVEYRGILDDRGN